MASDSAPLLPVTEVEGVAPSTYLGRARHDRAHGLDRHQRHRQAAGGRDGGGLGGGRAPWARWPASSPRRAARAWWASPAGPEKCALLTEQLGFDAAVDYKAADWRDQLVAATPDGIDVDFENVGGDIMDAVFARLNLRARVALCGLISGYNDTEPPPGPRSFGNLLVNRVLLQGFIVLDHFHRAPEAIAELGGLLADGRLKPLETVGRGLRAAARPRSTCCSTARTSASSS